MPRGNAAERLAVLETELPHVWETLEATRAETREAISALRDELRGLRETVTSLRDTLSRYALTALLLASSALLQASKAPEAAEAAGALLKHVLKMLLL